MLSIGRSRLASTAQLTFISINAVGLLFGTIYNTKTPDLYENNVHHKLGWVVTWIASVQTILVLLRKHGRAGNTSRTSYETTIAPYRNFQNLRSAQQYRYSRDSGQGTEPSTPRNSSTSATQAYEEDGEDTPMFKREDDFEGHIEKHRLWRSKAANRILSKKVLEATQTRVVRYIYVLYDTTDRLILFLGFATLLSGLVTYGGIFVRHSSHPNSSRKLT